MMRTIIVSAALAIGITAVVAQSNSLAQRQDLMKANGAAERTGRQMVRGETPFDLGKAKEILQTFAKTADTAHNYFLESPKTGEKTRAAPKIWENQSDFRKRFDTWAADIKKASAQVNDLSSFKEAFGTVTKACGGCHENFRIKKS